MALIEYLQDEDLVNGAKDAVNVAFGEIIISAVLTDGNLILTKRSGVTITVPLKNQFAALDTVFDAVLPGIADHDTPGTVRIVDDSIPTELLSESGVLSAAGVVRLIEAISPGLADVLKINRIGYGSIDLRYDPTDDDTPDADQLPRLKLYLKDDAQNDLLVGEFAVEPQTGVIIKHLGQNRIIANATGVQTFGDKLFIEQQVSAATAILRQMPTVKTATNIVIARSVDSGDSIEKISVADLAKLVSQSVEIAQDLIIKSLTLTGGDSHIPATPINGVYVGIPTADGTGVVIASKYDFVQSLLSELIASLTAAGYGGGTGGGGGTTKQVRLEGCANEESTGQQRQIITLNHVALMTATPHNLKTNAIGIAKAYFVADGQSSGVSVLGAIDDYIEFYSTGSGSSTAYYLRIKATAPGYESGKLILMIERLDSDLTA